MKTILFLLVLAIGVSAQGSLYFAAGVPSNVKHPKLWTVDTDYGPFFIETVWKPKTPNYLGYGISDGAGGQHTILLGYQSNDEAWAVTGNFYTGSGFFSFSTPYVKKINEWGHVAVGYDGAKVRVWVDGMIVFEEAYSGVRKYLAGGSDGNLYVGGSFHNNFGGNIARVRLIEGACPFSQDFRPQLFFTRRIVTDHVDNFVTANFVADYTSPSEVFPDLSPGIGGEPRDGAFSRLYDGAAWPEFQSERPSPLIEQTHYPKPVPDGALIFDSFSRPNSTFLFSDQIVLGYTEGGSLGPLQWSDGFGILGEAAFARYNTLYQNVLDAGTGDVDVRVDRAWGTNTGLVLRYVNNQNYVFINGEPNRITVNFMINGTVTGQAVDVPSYTTLRAVAVGNQMTVHADGLNVGSFAVPAALNGTKHGLSYAGPRSFYDNFTVFGMN